MRTALLVSITALVIASACGGVPREARIGVEQLSDGVARADVLLEERIKTRGPEVQRQVLEDTIAGLINSVDEGLDEFDRLMAPETTAVQVLIVTRSSLLAVEDALDAWDAGVGPANFIGAAACAVLALADLAGAFDAAGLELPEIVISGTQTLATFATGACPEPPTISDADSEGGQ